jgi:RNA polymerase sigma factor (sigma-70 family)
MGFRHLEEPVNSAVARTTTHLLEGLYDDRNRDAWEEFDRRYRPILLRFLRQLGLDENNAADVAQETLTCFVQDYRLRRYDRTQGRLRTWLIGIARCRAVDLRRAEGRRHEDHVAGMLDMPAEDEFEQIWEAEQRRHIFDLAISELRSTTRLAEKTLAAFEAVVVRQKPVAEVSQEMGLTAQEIYDAKNRVAEKLREIIKRYEDCFWER